MDKDILNILNKLPDSVTVFFAENSDNNVTEIRIRENSDICICTDGIYKQIENSYICSNQLQNIFFSFCNNAIYAYEDQISQGFITLDGGHRVGIAGVFVNNPNGKIQLSKVTSLNIRIAKFLKFHISDEILHFNKGLLVCGKPHSGKTTFIRNLCVRLNGKNYTVCDERKEIYHPSLYGDFIISLPKSVAILQAVRVMNPDYIICDEIGSKNEAENILSAMHSGVKFICSAHCDSIQDLYNKPNIKLLLENNVFDKVVLLDASDNVFWIKEVSCV